MAYNRKGKNDKPNVLIEFIEYIKSEIEKRGAQKYVLFGAAGLAVFVIIIAATLNAGKNNTKSADKDSEGVIAVTPSVETVSEEGVKNPLLENALPDINDLMKTYFDVKLTGDLETYNKIVDSEEEMTQEKLEQSQELIEAYDNITCYTKQGLLDNTYIVFVTFDIKFKNIETLAPALRRHFIMMDEEGNPYIYERELDGEVKTYTQELCNDADVSALYTDVDKRLAAAKKSDEELEKLFQLFEKALSPEDETGAFKEGSSEPDSADSETTKAAD